MKRRSQPGLFDVGEDTTQLTDDRIEYPIRDRLNFMRFLGLQLEDRVLDR